MSTDLPAPQPPVEPAEAAPLTANLRWLYAGRALRSFSTAFLTVVFPLYLAARHESATTVGLVLTVGSLVGAGLVAAVGLLGDRLGRRPLLIALGLLGAVGAAALAASTSLAVVIVASGLGGVGRGGGAGSGGGFGPFLPAEQPLLTASVAPSQRTRAFGRMSFLGSVASAAGSVVAGLPSLLHHTGLGWVDAYRVVFLVGAAGSLLVTAVCVPLREPARRPAARPAPGAEPAGGPGQGPAGLSTRGLIGRLGLANAINGLGFGFVGPLLTYWFYVRYGVGPAEVGVLYMAVNLVSAVPYLGAHHLTARLGTVRTVVFARSGSLLALLSMAAAPSFAVAGLLFCVRIIFNSLSVPARQSFAMGAADEHRRGAVAALSMLPAVGTSSVTPVIGGALMGAFVDVPILGAVVFMGASVVYYYYAFRDATLPEEAGLRTARAAAARLDAQAELRTRRSP